MKDLFVLGIIAIVLIGAIAYIIKEKKRGVQCIGCPVESCSRTSCESMKEYYNSVK